jgi:tRNA-specific 2-thiouridylase
MIFARTKPRINKTVFVGVSGGVDSSVSAKRLIDQGYKVVGAFMKTWYPDWLQCDWKAERRDAMRVCAKLELPFVEYDLADSYFREVGMYLVDEYRAGRTPNPDVMCNRHVKFDAFWRAAQADGADLIATGHYARKGGPDKILMGIDQNKDQTYFLWGINPTIVPQILFPIGDATKDKIRNEANQSGLITATKPDSQGICFLGQVDLKEFLGHYLDLQPGPVKNLAGKTIGSHDSAYVYTVGQRHGFKIDNRQTDSEVLYVIKKDVNKNILIAGTKNELNEATRKSEVKLVQTNWFQDVDPGINLTGRFRYRQPLIDLTLKTIHTTANTAIIKFADPQSGVASGQSLVIYDGEVMVGGGIISE